MKSSMYRRVNQQEETEEDAYDLSDYRDVINEQRNQPARGIPAYYAYSDEMDERDSIYLDAVSLNSDGTNRKSLYLSRQTVYHSAEDVNSVDGNGTLRGLQITSEALLVDSRANGGLANLPYEPKPTTSSTGILGGILRRPARLTEYNEQTWNRFRDGERVVDFVLAYDGVDASKDRIEKRLTYQENIKAEGLEIEVEDSQQVHFLKIHVPDEVLSRYCEIMKMKMPIVKLKSQDNIVPKDFSFQNTLERFFHKLMLTCVNLSVDQEQFPSKEFRLLHEYARDKPYLFDDAQPNFFTPSIRIAVAHLVLERASFSKNRDNDRDIGLRRLLEEQIYSEAYPLHDGCTDKQSESCQRTMLLEQWASMKQWIKYQPLDYIKEYFGVKIAMYFAWLGFYTFMLVPASIVGLLCFAYGLLTYSSNRISQEICNDNSTIMCPQCDEYCDYWYLNSTCTISKLAHIFDNQFTILFSVFMSIWATLYLEMWKRYSSHIQHRWGIIEYCLLAEPPRPQYLARLKNVKNTSYNPTTGTVEPSPPFWTMKFPSFFWSYSVIFLFILLTIAAVFGIVIYRMSLMTSRNIYGDEGSISGRLILFPATTAFINLLVSTTLTYVYEHVAIYMTNIEYRRSQTEYNESLNLKIFLFEFVNYYSSIFYIAFIKGKFPGYPAKYNRILSLRQEECSPGGCLMELCIQLAIIMVGKQTIGSIIEILTSFLKPKLKECRKGNQPNDTVKCCNQWTSDFNLINWHDRSLFDEYLEMVIQYGFITIFVVAFPLGPFFALLNNIFETRLDAKKFLLHYKRPVPQRVRDLGIWYNIMHVIGKVAVISSAFIIAFSSNFIPRLMYMYVVNSENTDEGFVNHTLAYFDVKHFEPRASPEFTKFDNVSVCRYSEYRNPPDDDRPYKRPLIYWHILAIRLAFVVIYQNVVGFVQIVVAWAIPDTPGRLRDQIKREQYLTNEYIIEQEKLKTQRRMCNNLAQNGYPPTKDNGGIPLFESPDDDQSDYRTSRIDFEQFQECETVTSRV